MIALVGSFSHCTNLQMWNPSCSYCAAGGDDMGNTERRNIRQRAAVVQKLVNSVIDNPSATLTVDTLQAWLSVPVDAAERILSRLAASGLVREVQHGVWVRAPLPCLATH